MYHTKKIGKGFYYFIVLCALGVHSVLFMSCSARIEGTLKADASAELNVRASLDPAMSQVIRSMSRSSGNRNTNANQPVIDGPAIARSFSVAPGIKTVTFRNTTPSTIEGTISITRVGDFLTIPRQVGGSRFISYEQRGQGGKITIILDRENGPKVLSLISEDVVDYLSSLFAPIASGEVLTRAEYLELVTSVYKKPVADEISAARIRASINFPRAITRIQGGIAKGALAEFNIPLLDILVLDRPVRYEVEW
jgi:hypothetical protein